MTAPTFRRHKTKNERIHEDESYRTDSGSDRVHRDCEHPAPLPRGSRHRSGLSTADAGDPAGPSAQTHIRGAAFRKAPTPQRLPQTGGGFFVARAPQQTLLFALHQHHWNIGIFFYMIEKDVLIARLAAPLCIIPIPTSSIDLSCKDLNNPCKKASGKPHTQLIHVKKGFSSLKN